MKHKKYGIKELKGVPVKFPSIKLKNISNASSTGSTDSATSTFYTETTNHVVTQGHQTHTITHDFFGTQYRTYIEILGDFDLLCKFLENVSTDITGHFSFLNLLGSKKTSNIFGKNHWTPTVGRYTQKLHRNRKILHRDKKLVFEHDHVLTDRTSLQDQILRLSTKIPDLVVASSVEYTTGKEVYVDLCKNGIEMLSVKTKLREIYTKDSPYLKKIIDMILNE